MLISTAALLILGQGPDFAGQGWFQFETAYYSTPFAVLHIEAYELLGPRPEDPHWEVAITSGRRRKEPGDAKFQVFRLRSGAVEWVDSNDCPFAPLLVEMRDLTPAYLFVPGVNLSDLHPGPPAGTHRGSSYTLIANTSQRAELEFAPRTGAQIQVTLNANSGALADWSDRFRGILEQCRWTVEADVMTPRLPVPSDRRTTRQTPAPQAPAPSTPGDDGERG
ncbi:hypothetical protein [Brevundimonas sp.]|uniref:hypothetical protein n=1 Tax=Brevundimonas sp. TaxID=1871086 RepID=UPI002B9127AA|nr:hypothetical protein [Brevundimonas sp.]HWQ87536.1 hypothetical protein [Brevundimonas sp.]